MTRYEELKILLKQLYYAKSKILGELVKDDSGNPILDAAGNPQFKGGVQYFKIGDTTYYRSTLKELTNEIARVEKQIEEYERKMRPPKKKFLGSIYDL